MSHKPITHWFQSQHITKERDKLLHFYLVWDSKIPVIKWIDHKPKNFNFTKKVKVGHNNDKINIALYGHFDQSKDNPFKDLDLIPKKNDYLEFTNGSLLKSVIQKSIRRHETDLAIRASFHLMRLKIIDFLRRITIIAIEDSCIHSHLSLFVWFMMAYPEIEFKSKYIRYFLGIVYYLAESRYYDRNNINIKISMDSNFYKSIWNQYGVNYDLLKSIYIRKLYGGMKGDLQMLENVCIVWYNKYKDSDFPIRFSDKIRPIQIKSYLNIDSIPTYCIDFHCFPFILKKLTERYPSLNTWELKKIIWNNSSKINFRLNQRLSYCQKWFLIKNDLEKIVTFIKKHRY